MKERSKISSLVQELHLWLDWRLIGFFRGGNFTWWSIYVIAMILYYQISLIKSRRVDKIWENSYWGHPLWRDTSPHSSPSINSLLKSSPFSMSFMLVLQVSFIQCHSLRVLAIRFRSNYCVYSSWPPRSSPLGYAPQFFHTDLMWVKLRSWYYEHTLVWINPPPFQWPMENGRSHHSRLIFICVWIERPASPWMVVSHLRIVRSLLNEKCAEIVSWFFNHHTGWPTHQSHEKDISLKPLVPI